MADFPKTFPSYLVKGDRKLHCRSYRFYSVWHSGASRRWKCFPCSHQNDGRFGRHYQTCISQKTESALQEIIPKDRPGDFNQAMMELGAVVCVPNGQPKCDLCPVRGFCQAGLHGTMEKFPVKAPKKPRVVEERTVLVIQDGSCTAIRKRPPKASLPDYTSFKYRRIPEP